MGWLALTLLVLAFVALAVPRWLVVQRAQNRIYTPAEAPPRPVALVFGAGLRRDGTPSLVLADRVAAAASLYHQGKVERLLLTGSAPSPSRDEPQAMRLLALSLGVPEDVLWMDNQGERTLASCQRAKNVFGIDSALLVTQRFHLPRALATCDGLGLTADGVAADLSSYSRRTQRFWELREVPATLMAVWETVLRGPTRQEPARG